MKELLAVGIPFHQGADPRYLEAAISSVLNQTRVPDKVILIQDGPVPDSLAEIVANYARDSRVRLLNIPENRGLGYALNESLKFAKATYYARMDADDIAEPNRFEEQLAYLEEHPDVDIVGTWAMDVDEDGRELSLRKVPVTHDEIRRCIWANPFLHPTVIFRRERILGLGGYDANWRLRQDYELWFRCLEGGLKLANVPKPLLRYRFTEQTLTRNKRSVALAQIRIGWRGCRRVGSPPIAYLGVCFPFIKAMIPPSIFMKIRGCIRRFDPRHQ